MTEELSQIELQQCVDNIRLGLLELGNNPELLSIAFYAKPPWKTQGEKDLDLLVVTSEIVSEDTYNIVNERLNLLAKNLPIDAWILTSTQLSQRMERIAGMNPTLPPILRNTSEWNGFGFVPITGEEYLTNTIVECYSHPEPGGPIPASPSEKIMFRS